jgi:hypothetical protein
VVICGCASLIILIVRGEKVMEDLSKTGCSGNEIFVLFNKYFKGDKN